MNLPLLVRTWRSQQGKLLAVVIGLVVWSLFMPVIYEQYGKQIAEFLKSGVIPPQFASFGTGDLLSLNGSIGLGFIHPIAIALNVVFAAGFPVAAVAGERQRGTLEVLLARPISRRRLYLTLLIATLAFVAIAVAAEVAGTVFGATLAGALADLDAARLPSMWLNGFLVYGAIGAFALAASVSFDRLTPAIGVTVALVLVSYFLEILGSLWPDAKGLQPYSLFHYLVPREALAGALEPIDFAAPIAAAAVFIAYALAVFPRRDLAAPS